MRKKSQEELGTLVTREMKVMLQDEGLTKEQRFDVLAAVMFDTPIKNALLASFAKSLKAGFDRVNTVRYKAINCHRESAREEARRAREAKRKLADIDYNDNQLQSIDINGNQLTTTSTHIHRQSKSISPYKPPKGGGKVPKAIEAEDLLTDSPKKGGGRCRFTDANGYCTNKNMQGGGFKCMGPECEGREEVDEIRPQDLASMTYTRAQLTYDLMQTEAFGRMRVSERNLKRCLIPLAEKNSARLAEWAKEVLDGLAAWTAAWKADDWQYAPGKITKWLADEKYLQPPRKKTAAPESVGSGCGDCGAQIA